MIGVNSSVKVGLVTTHAVRRSIGVITGGMAGRAIRNIVALRQWEKTVVNRSRSPTRNRRVACSTVGGEANIRMVWIGRSIVIGLVTAHAVCRGISVIAGGMARRAIRNVVPLRQREETVVNRSRTPAGNGCVTRSTVGGETNIRVVWIGCSIEIGLVAAYAVRRSIGVITGGMAGRAIRNIVPLCQREEAVIDRSRSPARNRRVARSAVSGET